ncbi:uncharacterized protein LOC105689788 [Athalia rosae]|uniref:uncharacterized protein LOC105689788 n=1 Tax=Athalia rosae TaxID=37344 RepID=UPI0020335540|nr:uncharacterized protein LOC105689788 [Athalia rosae]
MAFNKVFIILTLAACAMAMPVQLVDNIKSSTEAGTTVGFVAEDTTTEQAIIAKDTTEAAITEDKSAVSDSVATTTVSEEATHQDLFKRSADAQDASSDDLETAAGTNVLRPLFVYRQQVAYRQRIKNGHRRGNRRF